MTPEWVEALEWYEMTLGAAGAPDTTVGLRLYHLRRLARESGLTTPWQATSADLLQFMAGHRWAGETRRSYRSSLRSFYRAGHAAGRIDEDPALGLPSIKPTPPRPRPVPHDDYAMALALASPRDRLMLRLAAEAGLRRAEVAQVHSRDLLEDLGGWSLEVHGKGGKHRLVPLTESLARELRLLPAGWVFPGAIDGHVSAKWVGTIVGRLLPDGYSMHKLRHMFATDAYALDRDLFTVQDLLGHASPVTTRAYVLTPDGAKRATVEALADARRRRPGPPASERHRPRPSRSTR